MKIDFFASESQYWDHMKPVAEALPPEYWSSPNSFLTGLTGDGPIVVASYKDFVFVREATNRGPRRPLVLMEHGAGQTYSGAGGSAYAGGEDRRGCALYLSPGPYATHAHRLNHPSVPCVEIGLPKLEELVRARAAKPPHDPAWSPSVAFAWHWDCHVCEETKATWGYWLTELRKVDASIVKLGHGHPRERERLAEVYRLYDFYQYWDFRDIIRKADLLVVDNSSVAFEALAAGCPVLLLESPNWRPSAQHGLRFGKVGAMFPRCFDRKSLMPTIHQLLADPSIALAHRDEILDSVYYPRKNGAEVAAQALTALCTWQGSPNFREPF